VKDIQRPGVGTLLTDFFRLTGRVSPKLEEFVVPTVSVGDLSKGSPPPVCRSVSGRFSIGITAGERAVWAFTMAPGTIGRITSLSMLNVDVAGNFTVHFGSALAVFPTTAITASLFTDGRLSAGDEEPAGKLFTDTQVGALTAFEWQRNVGIGEVVDYRPPNWLVGTGVPNVTGTLEFLCTGVANGVVFTMEWDEFQIV